MTIKGWKIWYGDNSVFTSNDGPWEEAPDQDVQVVMIYFAQLDNRGRSKRRIMQGCDYYYKDGDIFGQSFDDISECSGIIKYGKWAVVSEYNKIVETAMGDYSI